MIRRLIWPVPSKRSLIFAMPLNCSTKIVTKPPQNQIVTIIAGARIGPGVTSAEPYTHLDLLRTLEVMYDLEPLPKSAGARPIADIWR